MDAGSVDNPGDLEMALSNARDQREDIALWLALQVMLTDDVALADEVLADRLIVLQDRVEDIMRDRLGLPDRDAVHPVAGRPVTVHPVTEKPVTEKPA